MQKSTVKTYYGISKCVRKVEMKTWGCSWQVCTYPHRIFPEDTIESVQLKTCRRYFCNSLIFNTKYSQNSPKTSGGYAGVLKGRGTVANCRHRLVVYAEIRVMPKKDHQPRSAMTCELGRSKNCLQIVNVRVEPGK